MGEVYTGQTRQCFGISEINDRFYRNRMDIRHRQRIVDVGGINLMTQERVKCPFCSELILRDAIKCRFCGEWLARPDKDMKTGGPIEDSDLEDFGREHYPLVVKSNHSDLASSQENQRSDYQQLSTDNEHGEEGVGSVEPVEETPPVRIAKEVVPAEKAGLGSVRKGSRVPWLRALLLILYLGIVAALIVTEFGARRTFHEARIKEDAEDPNVAFAEYRTVRDTYPYTFASIKARQNLRRLGESQGFELPKPKWRAACEDLLGFELKEQDVHILPLAAWSISAVMMLLVFLTRIRRLGVAMVAFLLMILAVSGLVAQLVWYGLIPLSSVAEAIDQFMQAPETVYIASYVLLVLTAFMTLTATVPRIHLHIAKMAEATARKS